MRTLRQILSDSTLASLVQRREHELVVLRCVRETLPPNLAAQVDVVQSNLPELALVAASGAAAGLVRQRIPALLKHLQRKGLEFTGIQVRVQVRSGGLPGVKHVLKQLDSQSAATLRARAAQLSDPSLAAAVLRLADPAADNGLADAEKPSQGIQNKNRQ